MNLTLLFQRILNNFMCTTQYIQLIDIITTSTTIFFCLFNYCWKRRAKLDIISLISNDHIHTECQTITTICFILIYLFNFIFFPKDILLRRLFQYIIHKSNRIQGNIPNYQQIANCQMILDIYFYHYLIKKLQIQNSSLLIYTPSGPFIKSPV